MNYNQLSEFLKTKIRMSHIYQPVMIKRLLESGGLSHQDEIAKAILQYDETQLEYYVNITNNMDLQIGKLKSLLTKIHCSISRL